MIIASSMQKDCRVLWKTYKVSGRNAFGSMKVYKNPTETARDPYMILQNAMNYI